MSGLYVDNLAEIKTAGNGVVAIPATKADQAHVDGKWYAREAVGDGTIVDGVRHFTGHAYAQGMDVSLADWQDESRLAVTITRITLEGGQWVLKVATGSTASKKRSIVATDAEWAAIQDRATDLEKTAAEYLLDLAEEDIENFPRNPRKRGGQPLNEGWKGKLRKRKNSG